MDTAWSDAVSPVFCTVSSKVWVPVSSDGGLCGDFGSGLVCEYFFAKNRLLFHASSAFGCVVVPNVVATVCHVFATLVLGDISMVIVVSWIALVFIEGRFTSVRMALTGIVQSWPVMTHPT